MANTTPNPLRDSGKPLFFRVADPDALDLAPPPPRLGESLRLVVRSLSAMQKEALVASTRTGTIWRLASDEGAYLAGLDEAPCPLSFVTTGMVCAYLTEILTLAARRGIAVERVRLVQDNYYTMVGSALKGTMQGGAKNVDLTAQIASSASRDTLMQLVVDATRAAPIGGLVHGSKPSLFTLTHNGREIAPERALRLARAAVPDPRTVFDRAQPADGDSAALIRRGGPTPKAAHSVTLAGGSLTDHQDRLLHLRGICTLREDGVKEVEQHLYNPHGSIFRFLSDEAPAAGAAPRAPDAATYVSAGIGLCFMTQLGRYAKIARKRLDDYAITQDTHFSLAGGTVGLAEPVETHVFLDSHEDDTFARTALDMGEQTCFLHALLKADLKTRVSIGDYSDALPAVGRPHD